MPFFAYMSALGYYRNIQCNWIYFTETCNIVHCMIPT